MKLDLFLPARGAPNAVAMFIHGGYWQALDRSFFSHLARGLVAHDFAVAVPSYDLCPDVTIATIVDQMRAATSSLMHRFGQPLTVIGHSAGGHLAACLLATNWKHRDAVGAAYAISGLFELGPLTHTTINSALRLTAPQAEAMSPIGWKPPTGKHMVIAVGGDESGEYRRQSTQLCEIWGRAGVHTALNIIEGTNHFTIVTPLADPDSAMTQEIITLSRQAGLL